MQITAKTWNFSIHALLAESDTRACTTWCSCPYIFYPRSPCGERRYLSAVSRPRGAFSIHALLAESDILGNPCAGCPAFSIHALLAESDGIAPTLYGFGATFLSTLSLRRATPPRHWHGGVTGLFYPRSPCGERRHWQTGQSRTRHFLSTLSLRRATWN